MDAVLAEEFPFFEYSSAYFIYHLSELSHDDDLWLAFAKMGCAQSIFGRQQWPSISVVMSSKFYGTNITTALTSPLIHIVRDIQSESLVRRFVSAGYDIDDSWRGYKGLDWGGKTALYFCCSWALPGTKLTDLGLLLLELGANPNVGGRLTCLQHAL